MFTGSLKLGDIFNRKALQIELLGLLCYDTHKAV